MAVETRIPQVLSIAGSDSGGGAGIQADLKAFAACGVHGMTAVTAITAQNTVGVTDVHHVPAEMIKAQVRAVAQDIGVDAVKIGMLGTVQTIAAVARALDELPAGTPVVLDPVMVSESGAELLESAARVALVAELLPRATVITPNVPEARALLLAHRPASDAARWRAAEGDDGAKGAGRAEGAGRGEGADRTDSADRAEGAGRTEPDDDFALSAGVPELARALHRLGPQVVVVTGGHREHATDVYFDGRELVELPGERHPDGAAHGSGCTHSSVLAAQLAWGASPLEAARTAKEMAAQAVANGLSAVGQGPGPVDVLGLSSKEGWKPARTRLPL